MTHRPVGAGSSIAINTTSSQSSSFSVQSNALRLVSVGAGAHVAIGTDPTATTANYYVPNGQPTSLSIASVASNSVSGITTGATTVIDFFEGTASPFEPGDTVTLTSSGQPYYNFTHKTVLSVNRSSDRNGFFSERITIDTNTSGIATAFSTDASLRKSLKVAARTDSGNAVLYIQQVQITGQA
jgi:hypothetical protein